ncbi:hypothetical protein ABIB75_006911 [Bradyrhizobium sp. GM2.2]
MTFCELILKKTIRFSPGCQNFAVMPSGLGH